MDDGFDFISDREERLPELSEVPVALERLTDGREVIVLGRPIEYAEVNHLQGDNPFGYGGTCGLVACEDVLRQFGRDVTEADVLTYAIRNGLCATGGPPELRGGTSVFTQAAILEGCGVAAQVQAMGSLEELADAIEQDYACIAAVNAGVLWDEGSAYDDGGANHSVVVTGVARDPETGDLLGVFINDSGVPPAGDSGRFVDAATMRLAWQDAGGTCVVTEESHRR